MKGGLGRGLASLLDDVDSSQFSVNIESIDANPFQPRRVFDEDSIKSLAESIKEKGLIQPILVREKSNGRFELVAGERRLRAAKMAGLEEIPAIVRDMSDVDSLEIAILENIQREELNPIDEAEGYKRLMQEFHHTQDNIAKFTGKSRSYIANSLRLLNLPDYSKEMVMSGKISVGHAKLALSATDPDLFVQEIISNNLSVRQAEDVIKSTRKTSTGTREASKTSKVTSSSKTYTGEEDDELRAIENRISIVLGANTKIIIDDDGGSIVVKFNDLLQLDDILKKLVKSDV